MLQDVQAFSEAVVRAAERTRASAVARLRAEWQDLESTIAAATASARARVEHASDDLRKEMERAGMIEWPNSLAVDRAKKISLNDSIDPRVL